MSFHYLNAGAWGMTSWVFGVGQSGEEEAVYRSRGLHELLVVADRTSAEIQQHLPDKGTAFFDKI